LTTKLFIARRGGLVRVALVEDGRVAELAAEPLGAGDVVGNVYKGRIARVLPGMASAFVEVGLKRTAFLHASGLVPPEGAPKGVVLPIGEQIRAGDELIVQVEREPIGSKGARLTAQVSLAGRYVVYLPYGVGVGVSRRIVAPAERERLTGLGKSASPEGTGLVIRTLAAGTSDEEIRRDIEGLVARWQFIGERAAVAKAPSLLYEEAGLVTRSLRDLLGPEMTQVEVDTPEDLDRVQDFVRTVLHGDPDIVTLHEGPEPLFRKHAIDVQLDRALGDRVWLPSGGTIVIQQTEALVSIDVNSGRFVGRNDAEATALTTNIEAAREIARQLRLRNVGGIIVIDFIGMNSELHKQQVQEALAAAVARDRARTTLLPMSELGLIEMTRQRARSSLETTLTEPCEACHGTGGVRSTALLAAQAFGELRFQALSASFRIVHLDAHPRLATFIRENLTLEIRELEAECGATVQVHSEAAQPLDSFQVRGA
jgi:ribonuclease G